MTDNQKGKINKVIKSSFGVCHVNEPRIELELNSDATLKTPSEYEVDYTRKFYLFDVIPMGAVRMTKSDTWKTNPNHSDPNKRQREVVKRYFDFKNTVTFQAIQMKYALQEILEIVFLIPMPATWSEKKKTRMNKQPVKTRPDLDNYVKAFMDSMSSEDGFVWKINAEKRYAYRGSIIVYE
jgi:Holliday junction resolvase RusA-like endonuclease